MWKMILSLAAASFLAVGCAAERHTEIPASAIVVTEGNKTLSYTAPSAGRAYVFDSQHDRMIYSGDLERGQSVTVDIEKDKVTVDGRTVFEKGLHKGESHKIFFDSRM